MPCSYWRISCGFDGNSVTTCSFDIGLNFANKVFVVIQWIWLCWFRVEHFSDDFNMRASVSCVVENWARVWLIRPWW